MPCLDTGATLYGQHPSFGAASIFLYGGRHKCYPPSLVIDVPQAWLDRSGDRGLSIYIEISQYVRLSGEDLQGAYLPFIQMINNCSHCWENVRIEYNPQFLPHFSGNDHGAPRLRNLCLSLDEWDIENVYTITSSTVGHKATPSYVELECIQFKDVGIDWSNVTSVVFCEETILLDDCVVLLQHAPQLENFFADKVRDPEAIEWQRMTFPKQPIIHHTLKQFEVENYTGNSLELFFSGFAFPALIDVTLHKIQDISLPEYIIALFTRAPIPRIRCLNVAFTTICNDYTVLLRVLTTTPFLTKLSLRLSYDDGVNFLLFLASTSSFGKSDNTGTNFLPNLLTIDFLDTFFASVVDPSLLDKISGILEADGREIDMGQRPLTKVSLDLGFRESQDRVYLSSGARDRVIKISQCGVIFHDSQWMTFRGILTWSYFLIDYFPKNHHKFN